MPRIEWAQATDIGSVQQTNQDAVLSMCFTNMGDGKWQNVGLFIVADGMGGRGDGEKAAAIAVHTTSRILFDRVLKPLLDSGTCPSIEMEIIAAIQAANAEIVQVTPEAGSSITLALVIDNAVYIGHVGETRAFLISQDGIKQLTRVHDIVHRLVELGHLTWEESKTHYIVRHGPYRALGMSETLEVDMVACNLLSDSIMLLCSTGIIKVWSGGEEEKILIGNILMNMLSPQQACQELIAFAYDNYDAVSNTSAIVIKIV